MSLIHNTLHVLKVYSLMSVDMYTPVKAPTQPRQWAHASFPEVSSLSPYPPLLPRVSSQTLGHQGSPACHYRGICIFSNFRQVKLCIMHPFILGFLVSSTIILSSVYVWRISIVHSFSLLSSIPQCGVWLHLFSSSFISFTTIV